MPPRKLTPASVIVAVPGQISSRLGDEVIILSLLDGKYYGLNPVGARIWELISEPVSLEDVVEKLTAEYDVDVEACREDVMLLAGDLLGRGLASFAGDIE